MLFERLTQILKIYCSKELNRGFIMSFAQLFLPKSKLNPKLLFIIGYIGSCDASLSDTRKIFITPTIILGTLYYLNSNNIDIMIYQ